MEYFRAIELDSARAIAAWAIEDIKAQHPGHLLAPQYRFKHTLPDELLTLLNTELASRGVPELLYIQSYCRQAHHRQSIHIDGVNGRNIDNAVNIPLLGCKNSRHVYYTGDYTTIPKTVNGLTFSDILWQSTPRVADILYLDRPHLVRVNQPHSAQGNGVEQRWVLTMRFQGNPSYEDLCTRLTATVN